MADAKGRQTMIQHHLKRLANKYPVPAELKMQRRMPRLERMRDFYKAKAPDAPGNQRLLFLSFVSAIEYAATIIKQYRNLTQEIKALAEKEDDEIGTNSKS